jgi:MFS family permease
MPPRAAKAGTAATTPLARSRAFRLLLIGSSVSMLGSRVTTIAYPMLALYLTRSPVDAGWVAFAATAPSVLVYIPAGALVDLMDPKRVMLLSEFGRGLAITAVVAMVALDWRGIMWFVVAAVVEETLEVFSTLAERRYVRALVGPDQAKHALVQVEARTHVVVLAGRPLGGLLFEIWPIAPFLLDVLTFIASIGALLGIKRRQPTERSILASLIKCISTRGQFRKTITRLDQPPDWNIKSNIGEGVRWLWGKQSVRAGMILLASTTLISQALIMVFIAEANAQHLSPVTVGIVLAMSGLGGALGSALAGRSRVLFENFWIQIQMSVWSVAFILLAIFGSQLPAYMGMTMGILGFTGAISNIGFDTYLIKHVPENMLARVTSIGRLVSFSACAVGPVIGGFLFELYGTRNGVQETVRWLAGVTVSLALYSILTPSMRGLQTKDMQQRGVGITEAWALASGKQLVSIGAAFLYAMTIRAAMAGRMVLMSLRSLAQSDRGQGCHNPVGHIEPEIYARDALGPQLAASELHPQIQAVSQP